MKSLVTLGGQHQGVYGFPRCPGESIALCNIMRELLNLGAYVDLVQNTLVQAQVGVLSFPNIQQAVRCCFYQSLVLA